MIHYPKLIQIILNLTEIEALPKYIRNKSSEIQNLFSAEIPSLLNSLWRVYPLTEYPLAEYPGDEIGRVIIRVADVISYLPKLTGTMSSDTGIGWKNPVSKTFLPKTKFRVSVSIVTICAALNNSRLGKPS